MNHTAHFVTDLVATPLRDGKNWRLVHDLKFRDQVGNLHIVHAGFTTDFASIPSLSRIGAFLMLLGFALDRLVSDWGVILLLLGFVICWLADDLNGDDLLDGPATLHDEGYRRPRLGNTAWTMKFYWDWILFTAMRANSEPLWKCWLIWFNVAAFGWVAWFDDGRKHK
ncbi:MAG: DUF1353 domain-containing protein [Verrucomicrobiota bacterium]